MKKIVKVYYIDHRELNTSDEKTVDSIIPRYRNQIHSAKNEGKKTDALASGLLLLRHLGITSDSQIEVTESGALIWGKEHGLSSTPAFCLSHARDYSILGVCEFENENERIGCDIEEFPIDRENPNNSGLSIEKQKRHRALVAKKAFPACYRDAYQKAIDCEDEPHVFMRYWTQVEAVLKAEGTGFHLDPVKNPEVFDNWKISNLELPDHMISIAVPNSHEYEYTLIPSK